MLKKNLILILVLISPYFILQCITQVISLDDCITHFKNAGLAITNAKRALHKAAPLALNDSINVFAAK
jgi:hypothetical protein